MGFYKTVWAVSSVAVIQLAAAVVLIACDKTGGSQAATRTVDRNGAVDKPNDAARSNVAARTINLDLGGFQFAATLPVEWKMLPEQSDPSTGLVAFTIPWQAPTEQVHSLYFDATAELRIPASLSELAARLISTDQCQTPSACTVLGRTTLPAGGLMVGVKKPHAIYVESWTKGPSGRAIRCGVEVSDLAAPAGQTWLENEDAVRRAKLASEAICGSVTPAL